MYDFLFVHEWPWWFGGPLMGLFVLLYAYVYNRTVGMSSTLENVYRDPLGPRNLETQSAQSAALEAVREMGLSPEELAEMGISQEEIDQLSSADVAGETAKSKDVELQPLIFFVAVLVGALLASQISGAEYKFWLGEDFASVFDLSTESTIFMLFMGGILGGFGARMAGGCPSGHGLAGLSLFSPGSLVALTAYFVTGVSISFLVEML